MSLVETAQAIIFGENTRNDREVIDRCAGIANNQMPTSSKPKKASTAS